jgi:hypothetical protein
LTNRSRCGTIRHKKGKVPLEDSLKLFDEMKEKCDILYTNSKLPKYPNEELIKELLLKCLNYHWSENERKLESRRKSVQQRYI